MSARIDHAAEAMDSLRAAKEWETVEHAALLVADAQVHATLALVEQQRIANVIAYGQAMFNDSRGMPSAESNYLAGDGTNGYMTEADRAAIGVDFS